jgi:hypothetical protein
MKRIKYELWEIEGIMYLILSHFTGGIWGRVLLVWGILNIVTALIAQGVEAWKEKKDGN